MPGIPPQGLLANDLFINTSRPRPMRECRADPGFITQQAEGSGGRDGDGPGGEASGAPAPQERQGGDGAVGTWHVGPRAPLGCSHTCVPVQVQPVQAGAHTQRAWCVCVRTTTAPPADTPQPCAQA